MRALQEARHCVVTKHVCGGARLSGAQHLMRPASPPTSLPPAASLYTPLLVLLGAAVWNLHTYDIVLANPVLVLVIANLGILFSVGGWVYG